MTGQTRRFSKSVDIKATDADEMTATGLVLTPNELDHQLDWFDQEGVEAMHNPDPSDGVMHSVFPSGHSTLERNEVLGSAEEISGHQFDAGDWVVTRQYHDDERYALVESGVLGAFSMGGDISDVVEYDGVDDIPSDVTIPDSVNPDRVDDQYRPPTKVVDGSVEEISDVDMGAVPSSDFVAVKSSVGKNILDDAGDREGFIDLMVDRGSTEDEAQALFEYMASVAKSSVGKPFGPWDTFDDCVQSMTDEGYDEEAARSICGSLEEELKDEKMTDKNPVDVQNVDDETLGKRIKGFLGFGSDESEKGDPDTDDGGGLPEDAGDESQKLGQTLSQRNQHAVMASVDAQLDLLDDAGVNHGMTRFTDNGKFPGFNVSNYGGKAKGTEDGEDENMTEDDNSFADKLDEHGVVTQESLEATLKEALGDEYGDDPDGKSADEPPEWADAIKESVQENADAIEAISKQSGVSTQLENVEGEESKSKKKREVMELETEVFG